MFATNMLGHDDIFTLDPQKAPPCSTWKQVQATTWDADHDRPPETEYGEKLASSVSGIFGAMTVAITLAISVLEIARNKYIKDDGSGTIFPNAEPLRMFSHFLSR